MIEIYTRSDCNWCFAAKRLLMVHGLSFHERIVDRDDEALAEFQALAEARTVPLVIIDGRPIGGFEDLDALAKSGGLPESSKKP